MDGMEKKVINQDNQHVELDDNALEKVSGGQSPSDGLGLPDWMNPVVNTITNIVNKK